MTTFFSALWALYIVYSFLMMCNDRFHFANLITVIVTHFLSKEIWHNCPFHLITTATRRRLHSRESPLAAKLARPILAIILQILVTIIIVFSLTYYFVPIPPQEPINRYFIILGLSILYFLSERSRSKGVDPS